MLTGRMLEHLSWTVGFGGRLLWQWIAVAVLCVRVCCVCGRKRPHVDERAGDSVAKVHAHRCLQSRAMRWLESREKTRSRRSAVLGESETMTVLLLPTESPEVVDVTSEPLNFATFRPWRQCLCQTP